MDIYFNCDVYKLCGHAYKSGTHTIYLVKDMFFEEFEDSNNKICREVVEWALANIISDGSMDGWKNLKETNANLKEK